MSAGHSVSAFTAWRARTWSTRSGSSHASTPAIRKRSRLGRASRDRGAAPDPRCGRRGRDATARRARRVARAAAALPARVHAEQRRRAAVGVVRRARARRRRDRVPCVPSRTGLPDAVFVSELRTIAADQLWLSPMRDRASFAVHFTWHPDPRPSAPRCASSRRRSRRTTPRPHWGKVFERPPEPAGCRAFRELIDALRPRAPVRQRLPRALRATRPTWPSGLLGGGLLRRRLLRRRLLRRRLLGRGLARCVFLAPGRASGGRRAARRRARR